MKKSTNKSIFAGVFAALAATSCCTIPLIATLFGAGSGASSNISWLNPLRPYFIGFAIIAIGYAWYVHLKPKKVESCCAVEKPKFHQTRGFLIGMTIFAILSMSFPYYSSIFYSSNTKKTVIVANENISKKTINIKGMTCSSCENHVNSEINKLEGIISVSTSHENSNTLVTFDRTKTNIKSIENAIKKTGYKIK